MKEKIVPIVSGGLDSTVMLWFLSSEYTVSEVISFNYAQTHKIETEHAKQILDLYAEKFERVNHLILDMDNIGQAISYGAITGNAELPKGRYDDRTQRITIVPNRNMIFLSIAAGRAITVGASNIGYAAHASDYSVYPDCRPEFIESLNKTLLLGNLWDPVHLIAPFRHITKTEIVKLGLEIDAPLHLTWSCYSSNDRPCLECGTCLERTESFLNNDIADPALSEREWGDAVEKFKESKAKLPLNK